ncbi:peptide MFS transporter [Sphingomonas sp. So64.6b]|uniref:peptide MFS transporter n=1 Tax=Sphingomonas sp. So64.6b TaxID=2997354 RepID=UPI00160163CA|nr:peptide MFS transporter [Sphingomonas sp. So64.6b]QNA82794.1 peptide MFS transporter [Sphingomonas sp. So64.6b]
MSDPAPLITASITADRSFLGHPKGLAYLAFTEAWERFSYYGMTALVVLYMVQQLFLPGHVENVAGLPTYRAALESVLGPLSAQGLASQTFGLYSGLVYFTPILGGWIADRLLGAKRTVVIGALLMSAGHFAMAFDHSFLLALLLLILGSGCLKGNISAQIGHLYPADDESRRTRAFTIFSMAINIGAVLGPLVCAGLAQAYGWHVGFGTAGVLMLLATVTYLAGQRYLPDQRPRRRDRVAAVPLTAAEWRTVLLLVVVMGITVFQTITYFQFFNVGLVWIDSHADLTTPLGHIPAPWFNSVDAFFSVIAVPPLIWLWAREARRGQESSDLTKIGIGAVLAAISAAIMALAAMLAGAGTASALIPFAAFALVGVAFLYYWPPYLALMSRAAPPNVNATMMGCAYLSLFIGNIIMGSVGTLYETMTPGAFWMLNAGISMIGALLVLLFGRALTRRLTGGPPQP